MSYLDNYNMRVLRGATSTKERITNDLERSFEKYLNESPTCKELFYTQVNQFPYSVGEDKKPDETKLSKELMSVNDITNNDRKALDEKNLRVRKTCNIDVGSYIYFDDTWFVVHHREHKIMDTYKTYTMRKCNQFLHYNYKGKLYYLPLSIKNLTLYSDGMADIKYTSTGDSKRMIAYGNNPISKTIDVGTRVMLTGKTTFRVTNMNDFEHNGKTGAEGITEALVLQTALIKNDDTKNNIAWNPESKEEDVSQENKIKGEQIIYIGSKENYHIDSLKGVEWSLDSDYIFCNIISQNDNSCTLKMDSSSRYIGASVILIAKDKISKDVIDMKTIKVRG